MNPKEVKSEDKKSHAIIERLNHKPAEHKHNSSQVDTQQKSKQLIEQQVAKTIMETLND